MELSRLIDPGPIPLVHIAERDNVFTAHFAEVRAPAPTAADNGEFNLSLGERVLRTAGECDDR